MRLQPLDRIVVSDATFRIEAVDSHRGLLFCSEFPPFENGQTWMHHVLHLASVLDLLD